MAYSAAKSAVIHMSRCAAAELSPQGIRVNAICPGLIATSIFGAAVGLPVAAADQMAARVAENASIAQPVKKPGLPEDIARAALYLASDESAFVTGTHIVVDGGITAGSRHAWDPAAGSPFRRHLRHAGGRTCRRAPCRGLSPRDYHRHPGMRVSACPGSACRRRLK